MCVGEGSVTVTRDDGINEHKCARRKACMYDIEVYEYMNAQTYAYK